MNEQLQTLVSPEAQLGDGVQLGHCTRIYPGAVIGDDCTIGDFCVIGHPAGGEWSGRPVKIGAGAIIRSHTVIYEGSELGPRLETGHHVLIREGTVAGVNLRIGSYSDLEGDCRIADYCRFHSYCHVSRGCRIGSFVWLYSLTTHTNDPLPPSDLRAPVTIEDGVVVCVGVTVLPGCVLRRGSFAASGSIVKGDVPVGAVVTGPEGKIIGHVSRLVHLEAGLHHPWMGHYGHHYPPDAQPRLRALEEAIMAGCASITAEARQARR